MTVQHSRGVRTIPFPILNTKLKPSQEGDVKQNVIAKFSRQIHPSWFAANGAGPPLHFPFSIIVHVLPFPLVGPNYTKVTVHNGCPTHPSGNVTPDGSLGETRRCPSLRRNCPECTMCLFFISQFCARQRLVLLFHFPLASYFDRNSHMYRAVLLPHLRARRGGTTRACCWVHLARNRDERAACESLMVSATPKL